MVRSFELEIHFFLGLVWLFVNIFLECHLCPVLCDISLFLKGFDTDSWS